MTVFSNRKMVIPILGNKNPPPKRIFSGGILTSSFFVIDITVIDITIKGVKKECQFLTHLLSHAYNSDQIKLFLKRCVITACGAVSA